VEGSGGVGGKSGEAGCTNNAINPLKGPERGGNESRGGGGGGGGGGVGGVCSTWVCPVWKEKGKGGERRFIKLSRLGEGGDQWGEIIE